MLTKAPARCANRATCFPYDFEQLHDECRPDMRFTEHIDISDWNGQCLLTVWDVELHDFLDDLFVQADLEPSTVRPRDAPGRLQFLFPVGITNESVYRLVAQVGTEEVERIVRINAPTEERPN